MIGARIAHDFEPTSVLFYWLARAWLWVSGWTVDGEPPQGVRKIVLIAAPHTSNWDFLHTFSATLVYRARVRIMAKESLFRFPFGPLMTLLGLIPVDRSGGRGIVAASAAMLRGADRMVLAVPASGTRSKAPHWRSGFYWIAHEAQVPILCGYVDYARKVTGLCGMVHPTGDIGADMAKIRAMYQGIRGRYPDQETPMWVREEGEE